MSNAEHIWYTYCLFRETGVPFYIGYGCNGRWNHHEKYARAGRKGYRFNIIRKMGSRGLEVPKVKLHEGLTEEVAKAYEIALIAAIGRADRGLGPLANLTDGGDGTTGHVQSPTAAAKGKANILAWREGLTSEQRVEAYRQISAKHKKWRDDLTQEERDRYYAVGTTALQNWMNSLSPEERNNFLTKAGAASKEWWNKLTPEERKEVNTARQLWREKLTPEERKERAVKISEKMRKWWGKVTPESSIKRSTKISATLTRYWENITSEQREAFGAKISAGKMGNRLGVKLSPEHIANIKAAKSAQWADGAAATRVKLKTAKRAYWAKQTPEQRTENAIKLNAGKRARYEAMPPEEREASLAKTRAKRAALKQARQEQKSPAEAAISAGLLFRSLERGV